MKRSPEPLVSAKSQHIDPNLVFSHPTVISLAAHLASLVSSSGDEVTDPIEDHIRDMDTLLQRYTAHLPATRFTPATHRPTKENVLITGTTGALGSMMLAKAIQDERVERVWAVNRGSKGGETIVERQRASFGDKGLDASLLTSDKVRFVEAELSQDHLGLEEALYNEVCSRLNNISGRHLLIDIFWLPDSGQHNSDHPQCLAPRLQSLSQFLRSSHQRFSQSRRPCPVQSECILHSLRLYLFRRSLPRLARRIESGARRTNQGPPHQCRKWVWREQIRD